MSLIVISDSPKRFEFLIRDKLGAELVRLENAVLDVSELCSKAQGKTVLLRVYSMYKLLPLAVILKTCAARVVNNPDLIVRCINRELLYETASERGIKTPRRYYVFDMCNVSDVRDKVRGKTLLLTFTKSEVEGFVETPQALVSLIEHRYFMSAEDVKVNLFIPDLVETWDVLVIGREIIAQCPDPAREIVQKVVDLFGEGIYTVRVGKQGEDYVLLDVDPVPELSEEHYDKALEFVKKLVS